MNKTKLKIYLNAYIVRMTNGEKLNDIDDDYRHLKKLTEDEIKKVHDELNKLRG